MKISICLIFCLSVFVQASLGQRDSSNNDDSRIRIGDGNTNKYSRTGFEVNSNGLNIKSETVSNTDNSIVIGEDIRATGNSRINIGNKNNLDSQDDHISSRLRDNFDKNDRNNKKRLGNTIATDNSNVNIGNFDRSKRNVEDELVTSNDRMKRGAWDVNVDVKNTWNKDNSMNFRNTEAKDGSLVQTGNGDRSKRSASEDLLTGEQDVITERISNVEESKHRQARDTVHVRNQNVVVKDNSMVFNNVYAQDSVVKIGNGDRSKRSVDDDDATSTDRSKRGIYDVKVDVVNTWNKDNSMKFGNTVATGKSTVNIGNGDRSKRNVKDEADTSNDRIKRGVWDVKVDVKNTWNKDNSMKFENTEAKDGSLVQIGNGDRSKRSVSELSSTGEQDVQNNKSNMEELPASGAKLRSARSNVYIDTQTKVYKDNSVHVNGVNTYGSAVINIANGRRSKRSVDNEAVSLNDRIKRGVWDVKVDVANTWNKDNSMTFKDTLAEGGSTVNIGNGNRSKRDVKAYNETNDRSKRGIYDVKIDVKNTWNKDNSMKFGDTKATGGSTVNTGNGDRS